MVDELRRGAGSLQPNGSRMHEDVMPVEAVADSVVHMASLPLHVNILTQVSFSSVAASQSWSLTVPLCPSSSSSTFSARRRSWPTRCPLSVVDKSFDAVMKQLTKSELEREPVARAGQTTPPRARRRTTRRR